MRYDIKVVVAPESDEKKETSKLSLHFEGQTTPVVLDVKGSSLLKVSRATPDLAQDFLCIAACVYAADKALARNLQEDKCRFLVASSIRSIRLHRIPDGRLLGNFF